MPVIGPLPFQPVDGQDAKGNNRQVNDGWRNWFSAVYNILAAITQYGTTAARPTQMLWISRRYFDTTLGYPIWWDGTQWVDATGAPA